MIISYIILNVDGSIVRLGPMASTGAPAYNGVIGLPNAGVYGRAPDQWALSWSFLTSNESNKICRTDWIW